MVFRRESKSDAFQRQISALRQQLGGAGNEGRDDDTAYDDSAGRRYDSDRGGSHTSQTTNGDHDSGGFTFSGFGSAPSFTPDNAAPAPNGHDLTLPVVDAQTSVVAPDATWKGDLESGGTLQVHGRVEGSLRAKNDIYIAEEANVDATLVATNVIVAGMVQGIIRCSGRLEVAAQGRISADVQAPTLIVHEGAYVVGQIRMGATQEQEGGQAAQGSDAPMRRAARGG